MQRTVDVKNICTPHKDTHTLLHERMHAYTKVHHCAVQDLYVCKSEFGLSGRWQSCIYAFVCIVCVCASYYVYAYACVCMLAAKCGEQEEEEARWFKGVFIYSLPSGPLWFQGDMATLVLGPLALVSLWPAFALPKPSTFLASCCPLFLFLLFRLWIWLSFSQCFLS